MIDSVSNPMEPANSNVAEPIPELAVVVPTYNESENVRALVDLLDKALADCHWEVIFVDDDSPDGTAATVRELARTDSRVRCIHRIGRRGLSSAVIEGMMITGADYVAVMDADLQHDETLLSRMLDALKRSDLDLAVGSRMVEGGDNKNLGGSRQAISELSSKLARKLLGIEVRDLMSGFFMIRRSVIEETVRNLSGAGFKILLDIVSSSPRKLKFVELPYTFRPRHAGESKLDTNAAVALAMTLIDKTVGRYLPSRMVAFLLVGGFGVAVHFVTVALALYVFETSFVVAQSVGTLVAMTSNFAINNLFTYADVRLKGRDWLYGWLSFVLACGFGALANVGVASVLYEGTLGWQLSALAGVLVSTAWNYGVTRMFTWQLR